MEVKLFSCGHPRTNANSMLRSRGAGRKRYICRECEYRRVAKYRAPSESAAIRAWAAQQGYDVSPVGRIPVHICEAYASREEEE